MSSDVKSQKSYSELLVALGVVLCFFVVFGGLFAGYVFKFDQQLKAENEVRLTEISHYVAAHMTTVVQDTKEALQAISCAVVALDSDVKRQDYMDKIARQYSFAFMGYAGPDGILHATVPTESVDVRHEPYFKNAMNGKMFVSDLVRKIFHSRAASGILLSVPLGKRDGVLVAMLETKKLRESLNLESFGGEGYTYIIDVDGTVVMRTKSLDFANIYLAWRSLRFQSGYSLEKVAQDVVNGKSGMTFYYDIAGNRKYAAYISLPFSNWTVVNIVSEQAVAGKTMMLSRELALIGCVLVCIFMGLMVWAMRSRHVSHESKLVAEAKSAFLANMSHEIRTPMNAIVGLSEIMLRDEVSPVHRDQLTSILNSGKGLLTIINDILDISKIESGNFTIVEEPYDLEMLLYDITIIVAIRIGDKPVKFLVDIDPTLPRSLVGDAGRVKQVLLNIVGNAIKFTQRGFIRLILRGEEDEQGWLLHVEVRDTGIGIKSEDIDKLFVRFNQVDTKRNRNVEGTGLGLTISQKLCEMMGGSITVQSEYGKGTSLLITLRQRSENSTPLVNPLVKPNGEEFYLLVCEYSCILREFECDCMNTLGIQYVMCQSLDDFEEKLRQSCFTHALASGEVLRSLQWDSAGTTCLINLRALGEHSLLDTEGMNIYLPLLYAHLPHVLNGTAEQFRAARHSSVDADVITPMPHVAVLVVDDNELNIMVAEGVMAPYEMQIDHAFSGKEALEAVQKRNYDLVLMDHMMPEMDGVEATQLIRNLPADKYKKLPIVALTANTTTEARQLFMAKGFNEFLAKPIETKKLNKVLNDWLREVNNIRAAAPRR